MNIKLIHHSLVSEKTAGHQTVFFIVKSLINKYVNTNKQKIFGCFIDLKKAFGSSVETGTFI